MTRIKSALMGSTVLVLAGAGVATAGSPTTAPADPVIVQPVVPVATTGDWTGGYYGAGLGLGKWDLGAASDNGRLEGAFAGYDHDFGSYVLGGEVQFHGQNATVGGTRINSVTRVKARAGYDAGPVLLYGVAGYGYADTSAGGANGYVAGVGMDYKFPNNIAVGAEYLYNDFGTVGGANLSGNTLEARISYRF